MLDLCCWMDFNICSHTLSCFLCKQDTDTLSWRQRPKLQTVHMAGGKRPLAICTLSPYVQEVSCHKFSCLISSAHERNLKYRQILPYVLSLLPYVLSLLSYVIYLMPWYSTHGKKPRAVYCLISSAHDRDLNYRKYTCQQTVTMALW